MTAIEYSRQYCSKRVRTRRGKAHYVVRGGMYNNRAYALCGVWAEYGTGSWDEGEMAKKIKLCRNCKRISEGVKSD